jgi:hypothetical protein
MTAAGVSVSIVASILMGLCTLIGQSGHIAAAQNNTGQQRTADDFKLSVKIIGLDYSVGNVKVWMTAPDGTTVTKLVNATKLLNSLHDDDNNAVEVLLAANKGFIQLGDKFTACVKILEDKDEIGKHFGCEKDTHKSSDSTEIITIRL